MTWVALLERETVLPNCLFCLNISTPNGHIISKALMHPSRHRRAEHKGLQSSDQHMEIFQGMDCLDGNIMNLGCSLMCPRQKMTDTIVQCSDAQLIRQPLRRPGMPLDLPQRHMLPYTELKQVQSVAMAPELWELFCT